MTKTAQGPPLGRRLTPACLLPSGGGSLLPACLPCAFRCRRSRARPRRFPIIVEYMGNGPFNDGHGDISSGRPEDSNLGWGMAEPAGTQYLPWGACPLWAGGQGGQGGARLIPRIHRQTLSPPSSLPSKCFFGSIGRQLKATSPLSEIRSPLSGCFSQWPVPG